jgi:hypothetical protein
MRELSTTIHGWVEASKQKSGRDHIIPWGQIVILEAPPFPSPTIKLVPANSGPTLSLHLPLEVIEMIYSFLDREEDVFSLGQL